VESAGPNTSGFVVSPIYQNVTLKANQASAHYAVDLQNTTAADQTFKLSTLDFGSLNDSGGVAFLGSSTSDFSKKYGLAKWMKLDDDTVIVPAGQTVKLGVTVDNSPSLVGGGHYGAILATAQTAPGDKAAQARVGVYAVLSSLILLLKEPSEAPGMAVVLQAHDGSWLAMPISVTDRFKNTGTVHVIPRGLVEVKDPRGKVVERGPLNVDSGIILPTASRTYQTQLMTLAGARVPGRYTITATYRIGNAAKSSTYVTTFFYLGPWGLTVGLALVVLALLIVIEWRFGLVRKSGLMQRLPRPRLRRRRA
jgi:hypothetical protein